MHIFFSNDNPKRTERFVLYQLHGIYVYCNMLSIFILGNCFDFSNVLCSLLLGAGYDSYVVSGYATKELCFMDEKRETCPLLKKKSEVRQLINFLICHLKQS